MNSISESHAKHWIPNVISRFVFSLGLVLGFVSCAKAMPLKCTHDAAIKAEAEASSLKTWDALFSSYKRYQQCDDGAISEGYSASVANLLTARWHQVDELAKLAAVHPEFERFVLHHIDETMTMDQGKAVKTNVQFNCPTIANRVCASIKKRYADLGF